jgi:hypothetical protein
MRGEFAPLVEKIARDSALPDHGTPSLIINQFLEDLQRKLQVLNAPLCVVVAGLF